MSLIGILIVISSIGIAILAVLYAVRKQTNEKTMRTKYNELLSQKKSSEITLGQVSEQLAPFLNGFKYDPKKLQFMGQPLDYIYFGDDKIVFIEVKSGNSKLNQKQINLKRLITEHKVYFETYRIKNDNKPTDKQQFRQLHGNRKQPSRFDGRRRNSLEKSSNPVQTGI